jgi:Domain of unknown function (DUF4404)
MDNFELRKTFKKMNQGLEQTDNLDDESRQRFQYLIGGIRTALDCEGPAPSEHSPSLNDQLNDGSQRIEISHSTLPAARRPAVDILSGIRI